MVDGVHFSSRQLAALIKKRQIDYLDLFEDVQAYNDGLVGRRQDQGARERVMKFLALDATLHSDDLDERQLLKQVDEAPKDVWGNSV